MNNEIGRKITSLTLMTIMVAGGLTFAFPGVTPEAHAANANLFVSAENSQFDNYMSGPQVIEVVVIDSDINETDEANGEPDVTVNGKILRMVQAVDGNWYGYFASTEQTILADATSGSQQTGLDFGATGCNDAQGLDATGLNLDDADGSAFDAATCDDDPATDNGNDIDFMNVIREAKEANENVPLGTGFTTAPDGLLVESWPFIQLYDLNPTGNVVIQYSPAGNAQTTTLTFDTAQDFAGIELDRSVYGQGMEVHATITDLWLNIDPTDEDSWTFAANEDSGLDNSFYQVFDENGQLEGDNVATNLFGLTSDELDDLMCDDNCILFINPNQQGGNDQLTLQTNDDSQILANFGTSNPEVIGDFQTAGGNLGGAYPVTVTEQGPNSGIFSTSDEGDVSSLKIVDDNFVRGESATIDYNDSPISVLTGYITGSVDIQPVDDEWNSGEAIPVVIDDADLNLNSRADEDLDLFNPLVDHIPTLQIGDPVTLENLASATLTTVVDGTVPLVDSDPNTEDIEEFSQRVFLRNLPVSPATTSTIADGDFVTLTLDETWDQFYRSMSQPGANDLTPGPDGFNGVNLINFDVRGIAENGVPSVDSVDVFARDQSGGSIQLADDEDEQSLLNLDGATGFYGLTGTDQVEIRIVLNTSSGPDVVAADATMPIVVDFFSFGFFNDGESAADRVANMLVRIEAEETGDNTGVFEGELEYTMINQLNILDEETYEGLSPIADDPTFIVFEDLTDEDAPRVNYLEIIDDGVPTKRADQEEAPSHSGVVAFDNDNYKVADTVYITLEDQDLNVDSDLLEIYTTVNDRTNSINGNDEFAFGTAGERDLPELSFGPLGRLLDVTFDDIAWKTPNPQGSCNLAGTSDTGLDAVTFSLVETDRETGVFIGSFEIPDRWCRADDGSPETTTGLDIEVNYVDFRDASGEIIEVGDSAGIRANTGSISLDRTVYPVPFGVPSNFDTTSDTSPSGRSLFPIHQTGISGSGIDNNTNGLDDGEFLPAGDLSVHLRVNDPDFDTSGAGEDFIASAIEDTSAVGPVKISVIRGAESVILGYAGGPEEQDGLIDADGKLSGNNITSELELVDDGSSGVPQFVNGEIISVSPAGTDRYV